MVKPFAIFACLVLLGVMFVAPALPPTDRATPDKPVSPASIATEDPPASAEWIFEGPPPAPAARPRDGLVDLPAPGSEAARRDAENRRANEN